MPVPLLECVANVSEGRKPEVIKAIGDAIRPHAAILDVHSDTVHNRSVITFVGSLDKVVAGALAGARTAVDRIDITQHDGAHPRLGAADVIPFVPLESATVDDAIRAAKDFAAAFAEEIRIPCFLYGLASASGASLPDVRRGAFKVVMPAFGPPGPHPTAGATSVGARGLLVAYNINIEGDISTANEIVRLVRQSSGGLAYVRAIGIELGVDRSQVSLNLIEPLKVTVADVFDKVSDLALTLGVKIVEAELVGLTPRKSLAGRPPQSVGLNSQPKILEEEIIRTFGG